MICISLKGFSDKIENRKNMNVLMKSSCREKFLMLYYLYVTRKKHLHPKELIFIMSHIFKKLKTLMHTYSHAWVLLYAFIYFPWLLIWNAM